MVDLEFQDRHAGTALRKSFYSRHCDIWQELDGELEALNASGADTGRARYAKRMMKDAVVIRAQSPLHILEVLHSLGRIVSQMSADIRKKTKNSDPVQLANLRFEIRELKRLRDRFDWIYRKATKQNDG